MTTGKAKAQNVRAWVQIDDKVFDISGCVGSMTLEYDQIDVTAIGDRYKSYIPGQANFTMNILGSASWHLADEFLRETEKKKNSPEWRCDFCGHINPMSARYCGHKDKHSVGCGARRSFLLEPE